MSAAARDATAFEREHPRLVQVGRFGWLAKGIVYVFAGFLAGLVALRVGASGIAATDASEASPTGAIVGLSGVPGGRVLLAFLTIGLGVYCLWRIATAVLPGGHGAKAVAMRIGYLVSAVFYAGLTLTALALVRHPARRTRVDGNETVRDLTRRVLVTPIGRFVVAMAGIIAVGAALFRLREALIGDATNEVSMQGTSAAVRRWTRRCAGIGEIGRAAAVALIGVFLLDAALAARAERATGLDGALVRIAALPWGPVLVFGVGVAFVLYGAVCIETFTRRELAPPPSS